MDSRILALLSAFCFGINPVVLKAGLIAGDTDVGVFVGLLSGLPALMLLSPMLGGFQFVGVPLPAMVYFALGGLFGVFLGRTMLYLSIRRLGSSRASTFKNSAPVVTAVLALLFLGELVSAQRWAGIAMVTVGLALVGNTARQQAVPVTISGLVIASLSAVSYGIRPLFSKVGLELAPVPLTATLISYITATALYLGYFLLKGRLASIRANRRYLGFFTTSGVLQVIGLLFLNYALAQSAVTTVYPISASAPLVTFILSYIVLRNVERLTTWDLTGTAAVVVGVALLLI